MLYKIKLHLGIGKDEWMRLPWPEQRWLLEGLSIEGKLARPTNGTEGARDAGDVGLDELASSGITVRRI